MSALDNLLKEIPQDYDEVDVANHLLYFRENATAELATLRAQLAEARDILIVLAYIDNMLSPEEKHEFVSVSIKTSTIRAARAWYNKVTTAQAVYTSGTPT